MRATLAAVALLAGGCFFGYRDAGGPDARAHRGAFVSEIVLTGELNAADGSTIAVPRLPSWQTSIKWLATDGAEVKEGDRVVELDNGPFASNLDTKKQAVVQAEQQLAQKQAEWAADLAQKELDAERKRVELDKAQLDAAVPKEVVSLRDYEDRQTKFKRATVEFEKARDLLRSQKEAVRADGANQQLILDRARRELKEAEDAIAALTLRAPRAGLVVIRESPFFGDARKLQVGDATFVGNAIALIPEPSSLRVEAALADVDDGRVRVGMPARIVLDAYPSTTYSGRVSEISAVAQESARMSMRRAFRVIVALDKIEPARMRPGLSARVVIRLEERANALLVPRGAIDFGRTLSAPAVIGNGRGARRAPEPVKVRLADGKLANVTLGPCNAQECVVVDGLHEGDRVHG